MFLREARLRKLVSTARIYGSEDGSLKTAAKLITRDPSAESPTTASPQQWSPTARFGFRFAFCYFLLSIGSVTGIIGLLPLIGYTIVSWIDQLWQRPVLWSAKHVFHLTGIAALPHLADSRDTALDWIALGLIVLIALLSAIAWTAVDNRRVEYQEVAAWLRFGLRLTLVFLMLRYGIMKIFPLQMPPPHLAVLNEPLGNTSPLTLLWTLIGLHPAYEMICGGVEALAALLLFFPRTSLLGALLSAITVTNVLLFNLFFDVPVKLGAANLLLYSLAAIVPDLRTLFNIFWLHEPTALRDTWTPLLNRRAYRLGVRWFELIFLALTLVEFVPSDAHIYSKQQAALRNPSALTGEWRVESTLLTVNGRTVSLPVLTAEGSPMIALFIEQNGDVMVRSADDKLWRAQADVDFSKHSFALSSGYFDGERFNTNYIMEQLDAMHLILTPTGSARATNGTLTLLKVPLPERYPLLDRGFHWVNEWGLER